MGRLVITHSTYLEGLIPCLKKLIREPEIDTITPAVISRVKGRAPELRLKVSIPIRGGWKVVARRGSSAQEVFVVTGLSAVELEERIQQVLSRCARLELLAPLGADLNPTSPQERPPKLNCLVSVEVVTGLEQRGLSWKRSP